MEKVIEKDIKEIPPEAKEFILNLLEELKQKQTAKPEQKKVRAKNLTRSRRVLTYGDLDNILEEHRKKVLKDVLELNSHFADGTLENCKIASNETVELFFRENLILDRLEQLESKSPDSKVVLIEEMDKQTAKKKVRDYMKKHKRADTEELMENLRMDLRLLVEIIDELKEEGKIEGVKD